MELTKSAKTHLGVAVLAFGLGWIAGTIYQKKSLEDQIAQTLLGRFTGLKESERKREEGDQKPHSQGDTQDRTDPFENRLKIMEEREEAFDQSRKELDENMKRFDEEFQKHRNRKK